MKLQPNLAQILEVCCDLATRAGDEIMKVYNDEKLFLQVETKSDSSPLTIADKRANKLIVEGLRANFPDYAILSEEEKDDKSRRQNPLCFIVDPLDGTKEFIKRNGQFTVNIALAQEQSVVLGVIFVPATGDLYYAAQKIGSFYKNPQGEVFENHVSNTVGFDKPENIRLVMSSSHGSPIMEQLIEKYGFTNFVKMGSSLKGCLVARGDAEIYYRHGLTCEWDTAAMQCIAEQAGAIFRQMDGSKMLYNRENTLNEKGFYIINDAKNILI
ncbi:MAG: 3'(2'),5'-bisphosphate nucleotidase CysQ [Clostridia bacterium]